MKLAYLTSRYPAVSHTFIQREVAALRAAGFDVTTFSVRAVDPQSLLTRVDREEFGRTETILPAGPLRVLAALFGTLIGHPLRTARALRTAWRDRPRGVRAAIWAGFYFVEAVLLAAALRRHGIRHVHAHFANVAAAVAQLAAVLCDGSWSMTIHGLSDFGDPSANALAARLRSARFAVCVSRFGQAQAMLHLSPSAWDRLHLVYCGIDPDRFPAEPRPHNETPRILSVARLSPEKGHDVLLRALAVLRERGRVFRMVCVGDGPLRATLAERTRGLGLADCVEWVGAIGQDDIQPYYAAADLFVLPSLAEGLPVVLMEALAKGVPVVSSGMMGIPELVEHNRGGLLVPPGDHVALADALDRMLADDSLRSSTAEHGRARVLEQFDLRRNIAGLTRLFASELGADRA